MGSASETIDVSVVIPTYNRASQLRALLASLLAQDAVDVRHEIIVVDNASTDETPSVVRACIAGDPSGRLRYALEPRRGVSHARNTGVRLARGSIVAFLDDDGLPERDWLRGMKQAFDDHADADVIGGRIRPRWSTPPPSWMSEEHTGPVALQDRAEKAWIDRTNAAYCLLTANLGCRRRVFEEVGWFSPAYPRNQDREFELRLWRAGRRGLYLPSMTVIADVAPERLTKRYHRRWRVTTGKYHALMRFRDTVSRDGRLIDEPPTRRKLLGTPLFLYREWVRHAAGWVTALLRADGDKRFFHETRLWYLASFFWTRFQTDVVGRRTRDRDGGVQPADLQTHERPAQARADPQHLTRA